MVVFNQKKQELNVKGHGYFKIKTNFIIGDHVIEFDNIEQMKFDLNNQKCIETLNFYSVLPELSLLNRLKLAIIVLTG